MRNLIGKDKLVLILAAVCIVIAGILYYYNNIAIPAVYLKTEQTLRFELDDDFMPKVSVAVVANNGIARYTVLTADIVDSCVNIVEIPVKYTATNAASQKSQLINKITKEDLRPGEQIILDSLSVEEKWFNEYDRLKEYEVESIVSGELKSGNIIDIIVNYGNGDYDVVVPKVKVQKFIEGSFTHGNSQGTAPYKSHNLILSVDEIQYKDLEIAQKLGKLETRLYIDESQPASPKTFVYEKAVSLLNIEIQNKKEPTLSEDGGGV